MSYPLGIQPGLAYVADWFVDKIAENGEFVDVQALCFTYSYILLLLVDEGVRESTFYYIISPFFFIFPLFFERFLPFRFWGRCREGKGASPLYKIV